MPFQWWMKNSMLENDKGENYMTVYQIINTLLIQEKDLKPANRYPAKFNIFKNTGNNMLNNPSFKNSTGNSLGDCSLWIIITDHNHYHHYHHCHGHRRHYH